MWNGDALRNDEMMLSDDEIREEEALRQAQDDVGQLEKERLTMAQRYPGMHPAPRNDSMYRFLKMFESGNFRIIIEPMRDKPSDREG
jgi:hypothetical protein